MTVTDDYVLSAWLLEQIAKVEAAAPLVHHRECATASDWYFGGESVCDCGIPARVLAECEAQRRIIALHAMLTQPETEIVTTDGGAATVRMTGRTEYSCVACGDSYDERQWHLDEACETLYLLTLPFADRAGYREEWRP